MEWFLARGIPRSGGDSVLLTLADVRQKSDHDCGTACLDVVCRFWGVRERGPVKLANPISGMAPDVIESVLRSLGFQLVTGTMSVDDLRHFTRAGRPVLCPVGIEGGHWVVVAGVVRNRVHFHDPLTGAASLPAASWVTVWRDATRNGHEFRQWGIAAETG